jgi:hypothetical protein
MERLPGPPALLPMLVQKPAVTIGLSCEPNHRAVLLLGVVVIHRGAKTFRPGPKNLAAFSGVFMRFQPDADAPEGPMGEKQNELLQFSFNLALKVDFQGASSQKHASYLAESHLAWRLFGSMVRRAEGFPCPPVILTKVAADWARCPSDHVKMGHKGCHLIRVPSGKIRNPKKGLQTRYSGV